MPIQKPTMSLPTTSSGPGKLAARRRRAARRAALPRAGARRGGQVSRPHRSSAARRDAVLAGVRRVDAVLRRPAEEVRPAIRYTVTAQRSTAGHGAPSPSTPT